MRALIMNLVRRVLPHPAVVAKRERRRVAVQAIAERKGSERQRRIATMNQLRRELGLAPIPAFESKELPE
ncbi:hypothetical protein GO308_12770 [Sphingomonas sp. SFZ2018-12]|uniref:hypothetical protein n=1 Tax=Sphingomonas sp. SFZ2018-12 TaxID=2683197 RepID=UPI001F0D9586|nr:hypothetical protein [Sphingomonas sp. SFZ2018-12]MCH4893988.1 hypothetical protein [Sphingomonas sp. SFZ2018-12]